jgi:translation initiation factor IF-1
LSRENAIQLEGTVVELVSQAVVRVELANGHRLVAFAGRKNRAWAAGLVCGDRVLVEMSPCDFSSGRLRQKLESK